ncbi:MAG: Spx/MgsR family RNA polymerase-binding regulatory protein [Bacteroidetes bacterium]|nr:Spx/MgsR family RNA polymerase-binding regulatory protein [Bacteroidota bacterium]
MLTIYGIPNCDTVKKSRDTISNYGIEYIFHDYKKSGISRDKLEEWLQQIPLSTLVNKKSTTYRELDEQQKTDLENIETAIPVLMSNSSVMKRPVIEDQKIVAVGFDKGLYEELFSKG